MVSRENLAFSTGEDTIEEIDITEPGISNFDEKKPDFDQIEVWYLSVSTPQILKIIPFSVNTVFKLNSTNIHGIPVQINELKVKRGTGSPG